MHRPELQSLVEYWKIIRDETLKIEKTFHDVSRPKCDFDDLSPETVSKLVETEGWTFIEGTDAKWWNFPLYAWGKPTKPAKKLAPQTIRILKKIGGVEHAGFSVLLPRGIITPHHDAPVCDSPIGQLTYHLGLACPDHCYLIQNDVAHKECDGKLFSFTCNATHSAVNLSDKTRVILFATFTK